MTNRKENHGGQNIVQMYCFLGGAWWIMHLFWKKERQTTPNGGIQHSRVFPCLAYGNENGKELQGFVSPYIEAISQRDKKLGYPNVLSLSPLLKTSLNDLNCSCKSLKTVPFPQRAVNTRGPNLGRTVAPAHYMLLMFCSMFPFSVLFSF